MMLTRSLVKEIDKNRLRIQLQILIFALVLTMSVFDMIEIMMSIPLLTLLYDYLYSLLELLQFFQEI